MKTKVVHCKKEPYDVYIGRPSKWGNPYTHRESNVPGTFKVDTIEDAIRLYEAYINLHIKWQPELLDAIKSELKGKILGCWCKPGPCHGDILARLADSE